MVKVWTSNFVSYRVVEINIRNCCRCSVRDQRGSANDFYSLGPVFLLISFKNYVVETMMYCRL
jgi:hypothetical protein